MKPKEVIHKLILYRRIFEKGVFPVGFRFDAEPFDLAISALEKQEQDRWIPVTERPPEDGERVLITYDKNVIRATWDEMRGYFYDTSAMALDKEFVSAWKPLPEPYAEEEA